MESKSGQLLQRLQYGMEKKIANKRQLGARLAPELVRDTLQRFSEGLISADEAGEILELGRTRLYELRTAFLAAKGQEKVAEWYPGLSGGNHCPPWPKQVTAFLQEALAPGLGADRFTYAFAASEIMRRFKFAVDRGQVRAWAIANGMAVIAPSKRARLMAGGGNAIASASSFSWMPHQIISSGKANPNCLSSTCWTIAAVCKSDASSTTMRVCCLTLTSLARPCCAPGFRNRFMSTMQGSSGPPSKTLSPNLGNASAFMASPFDTPHPLKAKARSSASIKFGKVAYIPISGSPSSTSRPH